MMPETSLHIKRLYLFKRYFAGVLEVGPLALEVDVGLVPDDEHDVGGDLVWSLVTFPLERDLGPGLPAWLHVDGQHLDSVMVIYIGLEASMSV